MIFMASQTPKTPPVAPKARPSDDDGGSFMHTFAAANTIGRYTPTFMAPLKDGLRNVVKHGNVIPVKLSIHDCAGSVVSDRSLTIFLYAGVSSPEDVASADLVVATSVSAADTGNTMRIADGHYQYNLATKPLKVDEYGTTDEMVWHVVEKSVQAGYVRHGDLVAVLAGAPDTDGTVTDVLRVVTIE